MDSSQKARAVLFSSDAEGPIVSLRGSDLKSSATVGVTDNGPSLQLQDGQERIRASFGMTELGPSMRMYDSNSETRATFGIAQEVPIVSVAGPGGRGGVMMAAGGTGPGTLAKLGGDLVITKPDGKTIAWAAP